MGRESAEAGPSHPGTGRARAGPLRALGDQAWVRPLRRSVGVWTPKCRGFTLKLSGSGASHTDLLHPDVTQFPSSSPRWAPCIGRIPGAGSSAGANRPRRSRLRRRKAEAEARSKAGARARGRKPSADYDP